MTDPTGRPAREPSPPAARQRAAPASAPISMCTLRWRCPDRSPARPLEAEEGEIKDGILRMGSLVAERIIAAIVALENHDADAATAVIENDDDINTMEQRGLQPHHPDHRHAAAGGA